VQNERIQNRVIKTIMKKLKNKILSLFILILFLIMNANNFVYAKKFEQSKNIINLPSSFSTGQINQEIVNEAWSFSSAGEWDAFSPCSSSSLQLISLDDNLLLNADGKVEVYMKSVISNPSIIAPKYPGVSSGLYEETKFHYRGQGDNSHIGHEKTQLKVRYKDNTLTCPIGANRVVINGIDQNIITFESPTNVSGNKPTQINYNRAEALFVGFWNELEKKNMNNFCYVTLATDLVHQGHWLEHISSLSESKLGNFKVTNLENLDQEGVQGVFRIVRAQVTYNDSSPKTFTQIIPIFSWPDHSEINTEGENQKSNELQIQKGALKLTQLIAQIEKYRGNNLIGINCNAGAGRTGTVLNALLAYEILKNNPDVLGLDYLSMIKNHYKEIILQYEKLHADQFNKFIEYARQVIKQKKSLEDIEKEIKVSITKSMKEAAQAKECGSKPVISDKSELLIYKIQFLIKKLFSNLIIGFNKEQLNKIFILIADILGSEKISESFIIQGDNLIINDNDRINKIKSIFKSV
jgi:hypothetical protein